MNHFWLALGFLTIVPTRPFAYELDALGQAGKWFPIVGLFVGGVLVGMHFLLMQLFPPLLTAVLVVVLWVVLTGALHLDGVADCGDALWVPVSRARRLEILQDSRVGTFGSVALILFLLMKVTAVLGLQQPHVALLLAPMWARWFVLLVARRPAARGTGLGASFIRGVTPAVLLWGGVVPLILLGLGGVRGVITIVMTLFVTASVIRLAERQLGGVTGDVLGLSIELSELIIVLLYAVELHHG